MTQSNQSNLDPATGLPIVPGGQVPPPAGSASGGKPLPQVDMHMQASEFAQLRADVAAIGQTDVALGRVLDSLVLHVGHLHGFDPSIEDAKAEALARQAERDEEDASLKAAADARTAARATEDALPHTPEQLTALAASRATEDAQVQADADQLAKGRAEEDRLEAEEVAATPPPTVPAQPLPPLPPVPPTGVFVPADNEPMEG